jgi:hypothetical protein
MTFGKYLFESFCRNAANKLGIQWPKTNPTQMYSEIRAMADFRETLAKVPWVDDFKKKIRASLGSTDSAGPRTTSA